MPLIEPDGGKLINLIVPENQRSASKSEAESLPKLIINEHHLQWIHILSEGWASPITGFMREDQFLQTIHFNTIRHPNGTFANQSVPITLDISDQDYDRLRNTDAITLLKSNGEPVAILRDLEFYTNPKEEYAARTIGFTHAGHPTVERIMKMGAQLVGGDLEVLSPTVYNDGLDHYRLSPTELRAEFDKRGADAVYAFQLRNPVHNGHALLMNETKEQLKTQGYKNPVLLLHPLGGWTKEDDVPLDVRMRQHDAVLKDGILDPISTVISIFPSPMLYGGPTEVQWHAKARINAGASHYIVGRDPAGITHPETGEPIYDPFHGMKVLQMAIGLEKLEIIEFKFAAYDKVSGKMGFFDPSRADDFLMISGSQMREYAQNGETPPDGFMGERAWQVIAEYYVSIN